MLFLNSDMSQRRLSNHHKRQPSNMSKRRSVSGPNGSAAASVKGLRRLSLQFSSSVSSLISFSSHTPSEQQSLNGSGNPTPAHVAASKICLASSLQQQEPVAVEIAPVTETSVTVPPYAFKCCEFICENGMIEGIFRMNGSLRNITAMERKFSDGSLTDDWKFVLLKDGSVSDLENVSVSPHDVSTLLKRWISRIDGGVITQEVANAINDQCVYDKHHIPKARSETPTDTPITLNNPIFETPKHGSSSQHATRELEINYDQLKTPTDATHLNLDENTPIKQPKNGGARLPNLFIDQLVKLPIENLHLLVYLLSVFNKFNQEEVIQKTRMDTSNLAKMMQLSIFNTDELVNEPDMMVVGSMESFTELKNIYDNFENVLFNWIEYYDHLLDSLTPTIKSKQEEMNSVLSGTRIIPSNNVVKKAKSISSMDSDLSYNDDFDITIPKLSAPPGNAVKITATQNGNIPHASRIPLPNITTTIADADEIGGHDKDLENLEDSQRRLALLSVNDNSSDQGSIVYTPIDLSGNLGRQTVQLGGKAEQLQEDDEQLQEKAKQPEEKTEQPQEKTQTQNENIDYADANAHGHVSGAVEPKKKPSAGLGLKFKGMFKRKDPAVSTTNTSNAIEITKRSQKKEKEEIKKEKRKSSFFR